MNDQQSPYDPYYPQPQIIGYDAYGQPVYQQTHQPPQSQQAQGYDYDPYAQQQPQQPQGYGYDPYAQQQQQQPAPPQQAPYDPYGQQAPQAPPQGRQQPYDPYGHQQPQAQQQPYRPAPPAAPVAAPAGVPGQRRGAPEGPGGEDRDYRTEQFSFIEEPDEDSEDVIDWLKFTESRSERREEARRRGRNRIVALVVVLALVAIGGVGYLWSAGKLPGLGESGERPQNTATGPQQRDVIVVHLHNTQKGGTSTALLVDNTTTKQGTTVLLPNALTVADDEGSATTLGKSVEDDGSTGTREAIGNLLGTKITGTWRLDTPFLERLVELVGNIDITTDADVPGEKKGEAPLVKRGENQTLNGRAAVAYATYRGAGEAEAKQLQRFGQVMYGVLRKMSGDPKAATMTVETLAQILDPSLPEKDLGASLAKLAEHAKGGDYKTALLPVGQDGALSESASGGVVKDILGGKVSAPEQGAAVRVAIRNGSGNPDATEAARIVLINGGYAFLGGAKADRESKSQVVYKDELHKAAAAEVAKTLGLPAGSVKKGTTAGSADVTVVLGSDYKVKGGS
ncbi:MULTISPECIES: LCP family protein [Streptomyces]|uniref:LCP family protein n=1 Tax=Streptomyces solicathayae TaxID=3081768 RepID=A0ABZ0LY88_9ACTN|nr:LCP family protein [Streptomyces sp. HUAS YS2]WOX24417.1 LCP family protein [Streptomyces sp. HUAS YS2]